MQQAIGWASGALLLCTIVFQVVKQWRSGSVNGVSPLLFVGQFFASGGLLVYSYLGDDLVFVAINAAMCLAAAAGLATWWRGDDDDS